jgi:hypothetical protein
VALPQTPDRRTPARPNSIRFGAKAFTWDSTSSPERVSPRAFEGPHSGGPWGFPFAAGGKIYLWSTALLREWSSPSSSRRLTRCCPNQILEPVRETETRFRRLTVLLGAMGSMLTIAGGIGWAISVFLRGDLLISAILLVSAVALWVVRGVWRQPKTESAEWLPTSVPTEEPFLGTVLRVMPLILVAVLSIVAVFIITAANDPAIVSSFWFGMGVQNLVRASRVSMKQRSDRKVAYVILGTGSIHLPLRGGIH